MKLTPDMIDALNPEQRRLVMDTMRESREAEKGKPRAKSGTGRVGRQKAAHAAATHGLTDLEADMLVAIRIASLPEPIPQFAWHSERQFKADFAWPAARLLVEMQGGVFDRRAHGSVEGVLRDIERGNEAVLQGWRMLRFSRRELQEGSAIETLRKVLGE